MKLAVTANARERLTIDDSSSISSRTKSPSGVRPAGFFSFLGYGVRIRDFHTVHARGANRHGRRDEVLTMADVRAVLIDAAR